MSKLAYHEAGHAIVALALGYRIESIELDQAGARGQVTLDSAFTSSGHTRAELLDALTIAHAGEIAQEYAP